MYALIYLHTMSNCDIRYVGATAVGNIPKIYCLETLVSRWFMTGTDLLKNLSDSLAAGTRNPLGELTTLPRNPIRLEGALPGSPSPLVYFWHWGV
jgi:hypothetical protein